MTARFEECFAARSGARWSASTQCRPAWRRPIRRRLAAIGRAGDRRPAGSLAVRRSRAPQGARDPERRGPAVRLDRRGDRPARRRSARGHGARPQPDPAADPVPSRGPQRRPAGRILARRPRGEAARPDRRRPRPRPPRGLRAAGHSLPRVGHDPHLLHAHLPPRAAGHAEARDALRIAGGRRDGPGYRPCKICRPDPVPSPRDSGGASGCRVHSGRGPHRATHAPAKPASEARDLGGPDRALPRLGLHVPRDPGSRSRRSRHSSMAGARFLVAGLRFCTRWSVLRAGEPLRPSRREWRDSAIISAGLLLGGMGLVAVGEQTVSSGIAAVLIALLPAWLAIFSGLFFGDRCRASRSRGSRSAWSGS